MTTLRATVIMKSDISGSTVRFRALAEAQLHALEHRDRAADRLAMRIVITLGDVLHEEGALVGDTVVLTTRIESITPPDEIYLSVAAWLALNQAEIRTAFVDTFPLKGFSDSVSVYHVEQTHRTRVTRTSTSYLRTSVVSAES